MELKLNHPYTNAAGQKLEKLTLRRLKVKDLRAMTEQAGESSGKMELLGVARMANMVPEDLDEMDAADYQVLKGRFLGLLGIGDAPVVGDGIAGEAVQVSAE